MRTDILHVFVYPSMTDELERAFRARFYCLWQFKHHIQHSWELDVTNAEWEAERVYAGHLSYLLLFSEDKKR